GGTRRRQPLPGGLFRAGEHDSLEAGLVAAVARQAGLELRQTRQIAAASTRASGDGPVASVVLSISYMALIGPEQANQRGVVVWRSWYHYFPWEDWRHGRPACLKQEIEPALNAWAGAEPACVSEHPGRPPAPKQRTGPALNAWAGAEPACVSEHPGRAQRVRLCFGCDGAAWDEEKVVERYDLLCEAGLLRGGDTTGADVRPPNGALAQLRYAELGDHGRALASAIAELRRMI